VPPPGAAVSDFADIRAPGNADIVVNRAHSSQMARTVANEPVGSTVM